MTGRLRTVLGRHRHVDLYELEASLVYIVRSRPAKDTQKDPCLKQNVTTNQAVLLNKSVLWLIGANVIHACVCVCVCVSVCMCAG